MIDVIFTKVRWQHDLVYLDDIIVFSPTVYEHFTHGKQVLKMPHNVGVTLRFAKSRFFLTEVDYLGHFIKPGELVMAPETSEVVAKAKPPTIMRKMRSFLGQCNGHCRSVKNFSQIAASLNTYVKKGKPTS